MWLFWVSLGIFERRRWTDFWVLGFSFVEETMPKLEPGCSDIIESWMQLWMFSGYILIIACTFGAHFTVEPMHWFAYLWIPLQFLRNTKNRRWVASDSMATPLAIFVEVSESMLKGTHSKIRHRIFWCQAAGRSDWSAWIMQASENIRSKRNCLV